jgi:geranylgeranyl diphosphate synthase, type I
MMNEFKVFLDENIESINKGLVDVFIKIKKEHDSSSVIFSDLESLEEFVLRGGKRVRGLLVLLAYKVFSNQNQLSTDVIKISVITELIHAFLLIHDDIIDESNKRRNKATLHKIYESKAEPKNILNPSMYGVSKALLLGDTLYFIASIELFKTSFNDSLKIKLIKNFQNVLLTTCYGEILDYELNFIENLREKDIIDVAKFKTSIYSIQLPLELGFLIASEKNIVFNDSNKKKKVISFLKKFSYFLGVAYQLQDDLLDYNIDKSSGKEIFKDLKEGKRTLIVYNAIKKLNKDDLKFFNSCLGNKNLSFEDGEKIVNIFEKEQIFKEMNLEIEKLINFAIELVDKSNLEKNQKKYFIDLANFIMKREN